MEAPKSVVNSRKLIDEWRQLVVKAIDFVSKPKDSRREFVVLETFLYDASRGHDACLPLSSIWDDASGIAVLEDFEFALCLADLLDANGYTSIVAIAVVNQFVTMSQQFANWSQIWAGCSKDLREFLQSRILNLVMIGWTDPKRRTKKNLILRSIFDAASI